MHSVVESTEEMSVFIEMYKSGSVAIASECVLVFVVTYCETSSDLSNIGLLKVRGMLICISWITKIYQVSGFSSSTT